MARPGLSTSRPAAARPPARQSLSPADLDPLDSAATPIAPDPAIRKQRAQRHRELVAAGMSMEQAAAAMLAEDRAKRKAEQAAAEAAAAARWEADNAPVDPLDEPRTPEELRAKGLFGEREPGPRSIDGVPQRRPEEFATEREAMDYTARVPVSATDRMFARRGMLRNVDPAATFEPSQRDLDMRARGFEPVFGDDGNVTHMVAAPVDEVIPVPGASGRRGRRYDLEAPLMQDGAAVMRGDVPAPMFESAPRLGPSGVRYVYTPSPELREKNAAKARESLIQRQAAAAGMSAADMAALDPTARQRAVTDARQKELARREQNRRLNGQNPFITLGDPSLNEWQQYVLSQNLLQGNPPVTDPNAVRGAHSEQMNRIAELAMRNPAFMNGAQASVEDQLKQKRREAAQDKFDQLYSDNHGGMFGRNYTLDDRRRMVNYLRNQYQLSQSEAEAIADSRGPAVTVSPTPAPPAGGADPAAGVGAAVL